jgi:hypothetical protein
LSHSLRRPVSACIVDDDDLVDRMRLFPQRTKALHQQTGTAVCDDDGRDGHGNSVWLITAG